MCVEKTFTAQLEQLREMLTFIESFCLKKTDKADDINKIILSAEEALVNIIRHAYKNGHKDDLIEITLDENKEKTGIVIMIKDKGIPFNPLEKVKEFEIEKAKEELINKDGIYSGYGVYIFVKTMDHVEYKHDGNHNILLLLKYL